MSKKNKVGRPKKFKTVKSLENKINDYFDSITIDVPLTTKKAIGYKDKDKKIPMFEEIPILNNKGEQVIETKYFEHPSVGGMCKYLNIVRNTLLDYEKDAKFSDTVKMAKNRIEEYLENELYREKGHAGLIFNLKNNFGWVDKQEVDQNINANVDANVKKDVDLSKLTVEELKQLETIIDKTSNKETD